MLEARVIMLNVVFRVQVPCLRTIRVTFSSKAAQDQSPGFRVASRGGESHRRPQAPDRWYCIYPSGA